MPLNSLRQCKPLLGTYVEIYLEADEDDNALLDLSLASFSEIERIQTLMSFHDPESELTRINQTAHLGPVKIGQDMIKLLTFALELSQMSHGYFDPTIAPELVQLGLLPDHGGQPATPHNWESLNLSNSTVQFSSPLKLDLGGIAKGYAVDRALAIIGPDIDATVNAGGDLAMTRWQGRNIEIRTPRSGGQNTINVPMQNQAVATSAAYYVKAEHAIIDPLKRQPFSGKQSVSVFEKSCMIADALTKIALLVEDPTAILRHFGATALIIGLEDELKQL